MAETTFESDQDALSHYRNLSKSLQCDLDDTRTALDEFQMSSKELEAELEKDLATTEKQLNELRRREESLAHEVDQWKSKYQTALRDHTKTMTHMQGELDSLRKSNEEYRTRLRDMELDNDELEGKERMVTSSLQDVESKFGKAIERITLLEDELIEHIRLEEECQRLRDDLRDALEETAVMRDQLASMQASHLARPASQAQPLSPSHDPISSPGSPQTSPRSKNVPRSETSLKLSRSPSHFSRSPAAKKASLLSDSAECTPRKRLTSLSVNASEMKGSNVVPKSLTTTNITKTSSLRISRRSAEIKPTINDFMSTNTRIPTLGMSPSTGPAKSALRRDAIPHTISKLPKAPNVHEPPIAANRSSHLQSLRAETQRMQGMTQKLVSSRTSRLVSAIPVPKPSLHSTTSKSVYMTSTAASRIPGMKVLARKSSIGTSLSKSSTRQTMQPSTTQDKDPSETEQHRRLAARRPQVPASALASNRCRLNRPASRLSMTSDQPSQLDPSRSATPAFALPPRRKASVDNTSDRYSSRPASSLGHYHSGHIRRKSAGVNALHLTRPDNLMYEDFAQQAAQLRKQLAKSIGPGVIRPRPSPTT